MPVGGWLPTRRLGNAEDWARGGVDLSVFAITDGLLRSRSTITTGAIGHPDPGRLHAFDQPEVVRWCARGRLATALAGLGRCRRRQPPAAAAAAAGAAVWPARADRWLIARIAASAVVRGGGSAALVRAAGRRSAGRCRRPVRSRIGAAASSLIAGYYPEGDRGPGRVGALHLGDGAAAGPRALPARGAGVLVASRRAPDALQPADQRVEDR